MKRLLVSFALLLALAIPTSAQMFGDRQTITVIDSGTACVTAPTACAIFSLDSMSSSVSVSVSGTWTGTLTFEGTNNDLVWTTLYATNLATNAKVQTTTASGLFSLGNGGVIKVRLRATAAVTGTAIVTAARGSGSAGASDSVAAGFGGAQATLGGTLFTSTTATSTTGLVEETLLSYTLPANTLAVNNRGVRITVWGSLAANANAKTVKLMFGGTILQVYSAGTGNNLAWNVSSTVLRSGSATQTENSNLIVGTAWLGSITGAITENLAAPVIITLKATTPTTIGDVTAAGMLVEAI